MGICPCHSECTEQALSRDTGYYEDTFGLYTDDDVYGILHHAIPAGLFISRFGYRRGVVFGLLLYGIGSLLFIPGQHYLSFNLFLFALFVIGCGLTFLETAANPYATVVRKGNCCQPAEFRAILQRSGMYLCTSTGWTAALLKDGRGLG